LRGDAALALVLLLHESTRRVSSSVWMLPARCLGLACCVCGTPCCNSRRFPVGRWPCCWRHISHAQRQRRAALRGLNAALQELSNEPKHAGVRRRQAVQNRSQRQGMPSDPGAPGLGYSSAHISGARPWFSSKQALTCSRGQELSMDAQHAGGYTGGPGRPPWGLSQICSLQPAAQPDPRLARALCGEEIESRDAKRTVG